MLARFSSDIAGPRILLRADMDALPIQEVSECFYQSENVGVAHLCGHDGHATSLLGCALALSENAIAMGEVTLLFQPAEETGQGGPAMIAELKRLELKFDAVYAYHNLPGYPLGKLVLRDDFFTAAVQSIAIKLHGQTAHAAEPEKGRCPAQAIGQLTALTQQWSLNQPDQPDFQLITPICIRMGEVAYGTMPGDGEVHFTLRCWGNERMDWLASQFEAQLKQIAQANQLDYSFEWRDVFRSCENQKDAVNVLESVAKYHKITPLYRSEPFKWGEDFGCFTQVFNGAMFGLGSGESQSALHQVDFDYPDALLPIASDFFTAIVRHHCGS